MFKHSNLIKQWTYRLQDWTAVVVTLFYYKCALNYQNGRYGLIDCKTAVHQTKKINTAKTHKTVFYDAWTVSIP